MPYFDAASAAPLHPVAREALVAALDDGWADPARLHREGRRARLLLDGARETVASALGCRADEVSFTGSGTTAAHLAVLGGLAARRRTSRTLVHSAVEHSSVLHAAGRHAADGGSVRVLGVDRTGRVDPADVVAALDAEPVALLSLQSANHEVGTLQPVAEAARACGERGVPLHVDAAQSVGRVPVPDGWALLSASARKWGGPPGVGVLVVRTGTRWRSPLPSDDREGGRVPGAPAVPAVVAAAASLRAAHAESEAEAVRLAALVDAVRRRVPQEVPDVEVVGHPTRRLPHVVTFSCLFVDGEALLTALDAEGVSVSSGSSCTASTLEPSHVLVAMGALSEGNVRVSLHRGTTSEDVEHLLRVLPGAVARVRATAGVADL